MGIGLAWPAGHQQFPWAVLVINVTGSLLIGALLELVALGRPHNARWRSLATTGFCGGFTTWSTFMVGSSELFTHGRPALAFGYLAASVILGLVAVVTGAGLTARLAPRLTAGGEP